MKKPPKKNTKYGWTPSLPDHRDHIYEAPVMATLPTSVDLRPNFGPVFNQGSIGSCTAQALAGLLQYDEIKQNKVNKNVPSRLFIYYNERYLQNTINSDSGASMRVGITSLVQFGFCDESLWVYDTTKWKLKPPTTAFSTAVKEKISSYARVSQVITQIKTALAAGNPIVFGFIVYDNFESATVASTGIMPMPHGNVLGGHAVVAVGYDDATQTILVRNSWGSGWGIQGYFKMPYAYITNTSLAADFWVVSFVP